MIRQPQEPRARGGALPRLQNHDGARCQETLTMRVRHRPPST